MKYTSIISLTLFVLLSLNSFATHYWEGDVNHSWNNPGNWDEGTVPGSGDDVIILAGTPYDCWVASTDQNCNYLFIMAGASLRVYDETLSIMGGLSVYGTLKMDNENGHIWAYGNVTWYSGSSANISAWARIYALGNWEFRNGSNVHLDDGFVSFLGSSTCSITCKSTNSYFNSLILTNNHDIEFSTTSTAPLVVNNDLSVGNSAVFVSNSSQDIIVNGLLDLYNGYLHFSSGTFVYNGPGTNVVLLSNYFNNLTVNPNGLLNCIHPFIINGDLTINGGMLETDNVHIYGDWINNVGSSAYIEGTAEVTFKGSAYQKCSNEVFYKLSIDKTGGYMFPEAGATIQVLGSFEISDGKLQMNNNSVLDIDGDVTIANGSAIDANYITDVIINFSGSPWVDNNTTVAGFYPGTSTFNFDHSSGYHGVNTDASDFFFYDIEITGGGSVFINENIRVLNDVTVSNGGWADNNYTYFDHYFYGDITVIGFNYFTDKKDIFFSGTNDQYLLAGNNGITLGNVTIDKSSKSGFDNKSNTVYFSSNYLYSDLDVNSLLINSGTLQMNHSWLTTQNDINLISGGKLAFDAGCELKIADGSDIYINPGGTFESIGSVSDPVIVSHISSGYYSFTVNGGGIIGAKHTIFEYMDNFGIYLTSGSSVDLNYPFDYCEFRNGISGGILLALNNAQNFTVTNAKFPQNTWGSNYNVFRTESSTNVTFEHAQGDFEGESFDYDPNNTVDWDYSPVMARVTLFLEGPFNGSGMNTDINGFLPLSQPYSLSPWNYNGTESVPGIPSASIVDWVLIALRTSGSDASTAGESSTVAYHAAFLLDDGSVVDADGSPNLPFMTGIATTDNVYMVVWHRNHLGVLSANPLIYTGGAYQYDFSTGSGQYFGGTLGCKDLGNNTWGLIAGNGDGSSQINLADKLYNWSFSCGESNYSSGDFNMNAQVNNQDKNDFWVQNYGKSSQIVD